MTVNQWVPAAHRGDAIGDSARRVRDLLRAKGHGSDLFALTIDDDLRDDVRPFADPAARTGDVTIFHYALPSPMTAAFATLPGGRVLQYHNITPAHFFAGYDVRVTDTAPGALPGLAVPAAAAFVERVDGPVNPKFGWTDVARFSALDIPAVNFGPGDPILAHKQDEHVPVEQILRCEQVLRSWLSEQLPAGGTSEGQEQS